MFINEYARQSCMMHLMNMHACMNMSMQKKEAKAEPKYKKRNV